MQLRAWAVLACLLNACQDAQAQAVEPQQVVDCERRTYNPGSGDYPDAEKEPACLAQLNGLVTRSGTLEQGRALSLQIAEGKIKHYEDEYHQDCSADKSQCDPIHTYHLIGYRPKEQLYILEKGYWEDVTALIVNRKTGADLEVDAPPRFSPSSRQFITLKPDYGSTSYTIKVYAAEGEMPAKLISKHELPDVGEMWEYTGWVGEREVTLTAGSGSEQIRAALVLSGSGWQLEW